MQICVNHSKLSITERYCEKNSGMMTSIYDRFLNGFFLHIRWSGGSTEYKELVRTALYYLDMFLLVVSSNSLMNEWVRAEVSVAMGGGDPWSYISPMDSNPVDIHKGLMKSPWYRRFGRRMYKVDFRVPLISTQLKFALRRDQMLGRIKC